MIRAPASRTKRTARPVKAVTSTLSKPVVTAPIIGATKLHHLDDAVAAVDLELTTDEIAQLEEPYVPHRVAGFA